MTNRTPLITIITATYNSAGSLEKCINSVSAQTYKNIEYIIVDGGSKDDTVAILKKYNNSITKWISEPDNGVYDAWNKGINLSKGEWIVFIGSDDVLYPHAMSKYVNYISSLPPEVELDYVSSKIHIATLKGDIIKTLGKPWNWNDFRKEFIVAHPGSLHSRDYFNNYGLYNSEYRICGDYDMLLRSGKNLKAGYLNDVTLEMSLGGLSDTTRVIKESYKVIRHTGGLPFLTAKLILTKMYLRYYVKHFLRFFGVYLKKS